jgi:hypothetical protein
MKTARNITLVSLLAAGVISVPAYAHKWIDNSAVKATVTFTEPNQHGFDFAATTTSGNTDYVNFVGVKEKLDWAIGLEHRIEGGWSRVFIDYDHFDNEQSSQLDTLAGGQTNLLGLANPTGSFGEYEVDADSVKFGIRHRLNHSKKSLVDFGAALSWIDVDRDVTFSQRAGANVRELQQEADFEAFGPFFDITAKHFLRSNNRTGLNVQAYAGAGLLYSETKFTSRLLDNGQVDSVFDREKVKGVTSEMIMKLAIGWDYCFSNKTVLATSLGYMMMHYSDVFDYGALGASYSNQARNNQVGDYGPFPFTRQGPFLEFKYTGMNF